MRIELIAIKKCGANAPGSTFFEPKYIATALVAIGKARYATKAMASQPVVKVIAAAPAAPVAPVVDTPVVPDAAVVPAVDVAAPEAPAVPAVEAPPAPGTTLPPVPKRTLSRKSSKEDEK